MGRASVVPLLRGLDKVAGEWDLVAQPTTASAAKLKLELIAAAQLLTLYVQGLSNGTDAGVSNFGHGGLRYIQGSCDDHICLRH